MAGHSASYRAAGTINPSRIVRPNDTAGANSFANTDLDIVEAGNSNYPLLGVSQEGSKHPPGITEFYSGTADLKAAADNDSVQVYGNNQNCRVQVKENTDVVFGQLVIADTQDTTELGVARGLLTPEMAVAASDDEGLFHTIGFFQQGVPSGVSADEVDPLVRMSVIVGAVYLPATS